ncbi:glucanase [Colletotrichum higginsianum]|nr:glucanase [Colletotrichum higginsianum]
MAARSLLAAALLGTAVFAVPIEERQACASVWSQCGGQNWAGPFCCVAGSTCVVGNPFYSQCLPGSAAPSSSSAVASSTTVRSSSTPVVSPSRTSTTGGPGPVTTTASTSVGTGPSTTRPPVSGGATYTGNPFVGVDLWANSYYASEISTLAIPLVATTPFVVYDLPDRDCAAAASNGEFAIADGGVAKYKEYIDAIRAMIIKYSDIRILLVIEPDSLANLVTNLNVPKCAGAQAAYLECTNYAVTQLNLPNVAMYLDAGHAGWLGWTANLGPSAQMYAKVFKDAGRPKALRGLVTNVSNYNAWSLSSPPSYTQGNSNFDEKRYIEALAPLLSAQGWDAQFIVDQGRSGKQPTGQEAWGDWCNAIGTGFGPRPSTNTGSSLVDAFVWVKPGGESDGTSNTSAVRYDHNCGKNDALKPAPEAGTWFQAYFEQLLKNANPAF